MKNKKIYKLLNNILEFQMASIGRLSESAELTVKIIMDHIESIANHQADIKKEIEKINEKSKPVQPRKDIPGHPMDKHEEKLMEAFGAKMCKAQKREGNES